MAPVNPISKQEVGSNLEIRATVCKNRDPFKTLFKLDSVLTLILYLHKVEFSYVSQCFDNEISMNQPMMGKLSG